MLAVHLCRSGRPRSLAAINYVDKSDRALLGNVHTLTRCLRTCPLLTVFLCSGASVCGCGCGCGCGCAWPSAYAFAFNLLTTLIFASFVSIHMLQALYAFGLMCTELFRSVNIQQFWFRSGKMATELRTLIYCTTHTQTTVIVLSRDRGSGSFT